MTKCTACSRKNHIFTPKPDGTDFKTCDDCRATKKKFRNNNKGKIKKANKKTNAKWNKINNAKWNPINDAKRAEARAEDRYEAALDLAEKLNMKNPMDADESEASARKILVENEAVFSTIKKKQHGLYVALCTQKTKEREPYIGAARHALTTIATSSKTTPSSGSIRTAPHMGSLDTALEWRGRLRT